MADVLERGWRGWARRYTRIRVALAALIAVVAVGVAIAAALHLRDGYNRESVPVGAMLAYGGIVLVGVALALSGMRQPEIAPAAEFTRPRMSPWNRIAIGFGLVLLLLTAELNGNVLRLDPAPWLPYNLQFLILVAAVSALTWGLCAAGRPRLLAWWSLPRSRRDELLFVGALTLIALFVRLVMIGPALRLYVDELHFTGAVQRIWWGQRENLLQPFSSITAFPYLYPYLQSVAVTLFGRDLGSIRAVSAVFGALSVPALYLLVRHLFDRKTALVAAALLLTFPPHLQFSRIGLNNIADPLFGLLAMGLLVRGVKTGNRYNFVLAGLALGLTQYFYEGGRLLYPPLILLWLLPLLLTVWRDVDRRHLLVFAVTALLIAFPVYYALAGMGRSAAQRIEAVGHDPEYWAAIQANPAMLPERLLARLNNNLLQLVGRSDGQYYYAESEPLLVVFLTPMALLGLGFVLWWLFTPGGLLLFLWLASTTITMSLLLETLATTARWVVIYPALVVLIALGLRCTLTLITGPLSRSRRESMLRGSLGAAVSLLVIAQAIYYFAYIVPDFLRYHYRYQPGQEAIWLAAEYLPPNTHLHLIHNEAVSEIDARGMIEFLVDGITLNTRPPAELTEDYLLQQDPLKHQAFILTTRDLIEDAGHYNMIETHFTITRMVESEDPYTGDYGFILLFSPAQPLTDLPVE